MSDDSRRNWSVRSGSKVWFRPPEGFKVIGLRVGSEKRRSIIVELAEDGSPSYGFDEFARISSAQFNSVINEASGLPTKPGP